MGWNVLRLDSQPLGVAQVSIPLTHVSCDGTKLLVPLDVALSTVGKVSRCLKNEEVKRKALVVLNGMCAKVNS